VNGIRPNEVEERRVIRLLSDAAADVAALPEREVDVLLESAKRGVANRRGSRRPGARQLNHVIATGVAAAVIIGAAVGSTFSSSGPASREPVTASASLASFPEGSALQLLLSISGNNHTS
jgi:hypothetical protein